MEAQNLPWPVADQNDMFNIVPSAPPSKVRILQNVFIIMIIIIVVFPLLTPSVTLGPHQP